MLFQGVQELAQVIADEGVSTGGIVTIALTMGMVILILIDRIFFMLKSWGVIPGKKAGNPGNPGNPGSSVKLKELHDWYTPKNVGEKPPCMNWLPIDEFMEHQEKTVVLLEKILAKVSNED